MEKAPDGRIFGRTVMAVTAFLSLLALAFSLCPGYLFSQAGQDADVVKLNARLVNLNVRVTDRAGKPVPFLKAEDFIVFEDGVEQTVTHFEPIQAPVNLVLLLDLSGSLGSKLDYLKKAAKGFIASLERDDRIAVATFTTRMTLESDFTSDHNRLAKRVGSIDYAAGDTAFYDALWATLDLLGTVKQARKAIVILTDGVDSSFIPNEQGSRRGFDELLERAAEEDATIYPVYFDTEREVVGGHYTHEVFAAARRQLEAIAQQTGGTYFRASGTEDLGAVYDRVAAELHALYSLAYAPQDARNDGRWRRITVRLKRAGLVARTRRGYYSR
jgi:Ca-activated chloride channel family protein